MSKRHSKKDKQNLAEKLRAYRNKHNITQEELARKLGVTVFSINRWETGKHYPTASVIKLMDMLKMFV